MRKVAAMLALGLALTGCAGTAQQPESTTPTLVTPTEVDIAMTAYRLAQEHGVNAVESEPTIWSTSQAVYGHVSTESAGPGMTTWFADVAIDTFPSKSALDAFTEFATSNGSVFYAGHTHNTYWTVMAQQGTQAQAKQVADALSK